MCQGRTDVVALLFARIEYGHGRGASGLYGRKFQSEKFECHRVHHRPDENAAEIRIGRSKNRTTLANKCQYNKNGLFLVLASAQRCILRLQSLTFSIDSQLNVMNLHEEKISNRKTKSAANTDGSAKVSDDSRFDRDDGWFQLVDGRDGESDFQSSSER